MTLKGVIFDLDGVLTDTAEFHYLAWKRWADEEGFPFSREINEKLRGVSRRASLEIILDGRAASAAQIAQWMARKNHYYQELLSALSPADLLPGIPELLDALDRAAIRYAVGSASKNARTVLEALHIADRLTVIADGHSVRHGKPAPDLFLFAARQMALASDKVVVVEDAESGIDAALTGGFATLGIGPASRVGLAHVTTATTHDLTLDLLREAQRVAQGWRVVESRWQPERQHHKETIFTTGNGWVAARGSFEEGYPNERRASFVHGLFDDAPIVFTEIANIPDWMSLELSLNGQPFSLAAGTILGYQRQLNLQDGLLIRNLRWQAPNGQISLLRFERLIGRAPREQLAIRLQLIPENWSGQVEIRGGLSVFSSNEGLLHWQAEQQGADSERAFLCSKTLRSGHTLALISQLARTDGSASVEGWPVRGQPTQSLSAFAEEGQPFTITKRITLADSRHSLNPLADSEARRREPFDFDRLVADNRRAWAAIWDAADVELWGDEEAQLALRFNMYQLFGVMPEPSDDVSIGAKTLSGFGYRGHVFWDTELFMLPLFTFTQPTQARELLMYRYRRLRGARDKARANGFEGAQFPWESAGKGDEVTPTWVPHFEDRTRLVRIWTGDIEIHITADIAYAVLQYWRATGDDQFMIDYGAEMLLDGAKFWASRAEWNEEEAVYEYTDVIGPDEYHDHVDNNAFTNHMARWQLQQGLALVRWLKESDPSKADSLTAQLDLSPERLAQWQQIARAIRLTELEGGLIEQFDGYFALNDPDLADFEPRHRSMHEILGIEGANAAQVIKQPDVLMLLFLMRDHVPHTTLQANWAYYDPRTDHSYGSSLGPSISAIMACEMGQPNLAYAHFMRAARADLTDVRGNAADGIHAASAGGLWQAAVMGFGGLTLSEADWRVEPRLPDHWRRLRFRFLHRGELHIISLDGKKDAPPLLTTEALSQDGATTP